MIKKVKYILFFIGLSCNLWSEIIIDNSKELYDVKLSIYDGSGSLLLSWEMPKDILPKKTNIYRKSSLNGDFDLIESIQEKNNKSNRYLDLNCKNFTRYFYFVEVIDETNKVYRSDNLRPSFGSIKKTIQQEGKTYKSKLSLFKTIIEKSFIKHNPSLDKKLFDALIILIFKDTIDKGTWLENFPIHLINEVTPIIEEENNYFGREILTELQDYEKLYRNQFLLTPEEWNFEISRMYNKAKDNWFGLKDLFQDYVEIIDSLPPVIIIGSENKKGKDNIIDLLIVDNSELDQKSIELFYNNDIIDVDISSLKTSNKVFQQIIPLSWKFAQLKIDDVEVDEVDFFEDKKIIKTLDQDIIPVENDFSLKRSKEHSDIWLNEIYWDASSSSISLEVSGIYDGSKSFMISLNGEELWVLDFNVSFDIMYADSTFSIESPGFENHILEYNIIEEGNPRVLEMFKLSLNEDINNHRFPDGKRWVLSKQNTFGSKNIDKKSTMDASLIPEVFVLYQNYPNPFNSNTRISFDLLQDATLSLYVTDATGRIKTIFSDKEFFNSGKYNFDWNAESFSTGVYFFTINAEVEGYLPILFSRKMIYLK